jgi:hypothetical protein
VVDVMPGAPVQEKVLAELGVASAGSGESKAPIAETSRWSLPFIRSGGRSVLRPSDQRFQTPAGEPSDAESGALIGVAPDVVMYARDRR